MTFGGSLVRKTLVLQTRSVSFGGSLVRNARFADLKRDSKPRLPRRVAGEMLGGIARYVCVRDVAAPCGFARPWWEVRLRGAAPLGIRAKHAGVNAARGW